MADANGRKLMVVAICRGTGAAMDTKARIVIVGAGRVGRLVASRLSELGRDVVVLDRDAQRIARISTDFAGQALVGDGGDAEALARTGLDDKSGLFALTDDDNLNFMIALCGRVQFGARQVVARVNDVGKEELFRDNDVVTINPTALAVERILSMVTDAREVRP